MTSEKLKECEHCKFIEKLGNYLHSCEDGMSPREYWIMTEIFVYLHGSDVCNGEENEKM